jgi:hypothetical protein
MDEKNRLANFRISFFLAGAKILTDTHVSSTQIQQQQQIVFFFI